MKMDPYKYLLKLQDIVAKLDQNGRKQKPGEFQIKPIFTRTQNNIVDRMYSFSNTNNAMYHRYFGQHFRLQTLVTSLGLTSLVPVTKAYIVQ